MTNEEKAKEIATKWYHDNAPDTAYRSAIQMAEWKDRIFEIKVRELLYNSFYEHSHANSHFCTDDFECKNIDEFVNEFVKRLK